MLSPPPFPFSESEAEAILRTGKLPWEDGFKRDLLDLDYEEIELICKHLRDEESYTKIKGAMAARPQLVAFVPKVIVSYRLEDNSLYMPQESYTEKFQQPVCFLGMVAHALYGLTFEQIMHMSSLRGRLEGPFTDLMVYTNDHSSLSLSKLADIVEGLYENQEKAKRLLDESANGDVPLALHVWDKITDVYARIISGCTKVQLRPWDYRSS